MPTLGYSQSDNYTTASVDSILLCTFKYGGDIQNFIDQFGKPKYYKEYSDPYPLEGYGKTFYIEYDSLKATFVEFYKKKILSNITVTGSSFFINVGKFSTIKVGDSLDKLKQFTKSYNFFVKQNQKPNKNDEQNFYIQLLIEKNDYQSSGLLNVIFRKDKIKEISFRFEDGT